MNIKPIETRYKGYRFRSRLEARWAVFFDALGTKWEYEKEGYDLDGEYYLPDFWLPNLGCWLEVKPSLPSEIEIEKAIGLAAATGAEVLIAWNLPGESDEGQMLSIWSDSAPNDFYNQAYHWWYACEKCHHVGTSFEAKYSYCPCAFEYDKAAYVSELPQCPACGSISIREKGSFDKCMNCGYRITDYSQIPNVSNRNRNGWVYDKKRIVGAYDAARSARFEHGQNGA